MGSAAPGARAWTPEHLGAVIRAHRANDEREDDSRTRILGELDRLAEPFDEDADPVHVTASGVVCGARGTVLHLHRRLGLWLQPGGHVEAGESPPDAARRETLEETGLDARHPGDEPRLIHMDVHDGGRGHTHLDLRYALFAPDLDPTPPARESQAVRWYDWEEAIRMADPGLVHALGPARELWEHARAGSERRAEPERGAS